MASTISGSSDSSSNPCVLALSRQYNTDRTADGLQAAIIFLSIERTLRSLFSTYTIANKRVTRVISYGEAKAILRKLELLNEESRKIPFKFHTYSSERKEDPSKDTFKGYVILRTLREITVLFIHTINKWEEHSDFLRFTRSGFSPVEALVFGGEMNSIVQKKLDGDSIKCCARLGNGRNGVVYETPLPRIVQKVNRVASASIVEAANTLLFTREARPPVAYLQSLPEHEGKSSLGMLVRKMEGTNLADAIKKGEDLIPSLEKILHTSLLDLEAMHRRGVRHGDLKLENVMTSGAIIDYGGLRFDGEETPWVVPILMHPTIGNYLMYIHYEQPGLRSRNPLAREAPVVFARVQEDTWALGEVAYKILFGKYTVEFWEGATTSSKDPLIEATALIYRNRETFLEHCRGELTRVKTPYAPLILDLLEPDMERALSASELLAKHAALFKPPEEIFPCAAASSGSGSD